MECTHKIMAKIRTKNWKVGDAPWKYYLVPCGRCMACRLNKGRDWSVRIMHEVKQSSASCFCTLTYDDAHLPANRSLDVKTCQDFMKRLRKNTGKKIRFFLGAEYGEQNKRPHYHVILFGLGREDQKAIENAWGLGFVHVGDVTADSASYVAGYTLKKLSGDRAAEYASRGVVPEFGLMSRRPGIGDCYVQDARNVEFMRNNGFVVRKGSKMGIPRFYQGKVFTTEELKNERKKKLEELCRKRLSERVSAYGGNVYDDKQSRHIVESFAEESRQSEVNLQKKQEMKRRKL